jgi:hypothetical protein
MIFASSKKPQSERVDLFGPNIHKYLKLLTDSEPDSNFHYGSWDKAREKAARNAIECFLDNFITKNAATMDAVLNKYESAKKAGKLGFFTHLCLILMICLGMRRTPGRKVCANVLWILPGAMRFGQLRMWAVRSRVEAVRGAEVWLDGIMLGQA